MPGVSKKEGTQTGLKRLRGCFFFQNVGSDKVKKVTYIIAVTYNGALTPYHSLKC